jgi:lipoyl(octanoyl) transferase
MTNPITTNSVTPKLAFHLLSVVKFEDYLRLQQSLVADLAAGGDCIKVLICEHTLELTVGRKGSHAHIRIPQSAREKQNLQTHWLPRGGGAILHSPGQLAVYPLVPLQWYGWSPGRVLALVRDAVSMALSQVGIVTLCYDGLHSVWGRTGMLAATGISVQQNVSCFGSYINVSPAMGLFGYVDTAWQLPADQSRRTMSSLMAENSKAARMANLRSAVVESFAQVFDCSDYDIHTGHPQLSPPSVLKPLPEI